MKRTIVFALTALPLLLTGCGYRLGNTDLGFSTIAIPKAASHTAEPRMALYATSRLRNAFIADGTLDVVDQNDADAVLSATVLSSRISTAGSAKLASPDEDQQIYATTIWRVTVTVEYAIHKAGNSQPIMGPRTVTGTAEFTDIVDLEVTKKDGTRQALVDASRKIASEVAHGGW